MSEGTTPAELAVTLPFGADAARDARTLIGRLLIQHGCDPQLVEDARLVVHELVMNGVNHGRPDARSEIAVSCRVLEGHVVISVRDQGSSGSVAMRSASADSMDGRGLAIVDALSDRWSVERNGGTRVEAWLAR